MFGLAVWTFRMSYCTTPGRIGDGLSKISKFLSPAIDDKKDLNSKRSKGIFVRENLKNKHSY